MVSNFSENIVEWHYFGRAKMWSCHSLQLAHLQFNGVNVTTTTTITTASMRTAKPTTANERYVRACVGVCAIKAAGALCQCCLSLRARLCVCVGVWVCAMMATLNLHIWYECAERKYLQGVRCSLRATHTSNYTVTHAHTHTYMCARAHLSTLTHSNSLCNFAIATSFHTIIQRLQHQPAPRHRARAFLPQNLVAAMPCCFCSGLVGVRCSAAPLWLCMQATRFCKRFSFCIFHVANECKRLVGWLHATQNANGWLWYLYSMPFNCIVTVSVVIVITNCRRVCCCCGC